MSKIICLSLSIFVFNSAWACPAVNKVPDVNCDGRVVITVLGDSFGKGIGDDRNDNQGGYVLRASKKLPDVEFFNASVPGLTTFQMLGLIKEQFVVGNDVVNSDIVVLDVGRNDRWLFGVPLASYRNLKRAGTLIKKKATQVNPLLASPPIVVTAALMLPNRGSQGPWVKELNQIILRNSAALNNPADLRFDTASKRLLQNDQLHPTSAGYNQLSKILIKYLTKGLPKGIKRSSRKKRR